MSSVEIRRVYKGYLEVDRYLVSKQTKTRTSNSLQNWAEKRGLNDQAYFVLLFSKLEEHINKECQKLILRKRNLRHWKSRRRWDNIEITQLDRITFMDRVSYLVDRQSHHFRDIKDLYEIRCKIAHGGVYTNPIHIPGYVNKFYNLITTLKS